MEKEAKKLQRKIYHERGSVFIVALLVIVIMLLLSMPFLFKLSAQYKTTDKSFKVLAATNLAEAGAERAIWELNHGDISTWNGDSDLRTMIISSFQGAGGTSIGDIEISVSDPEGETPIILATGQVPTIGTMTVDRTISVVLEREGGTSLFDYGVFGDEGVELEGNAEVDSYDSRDGLYGGENVNSNGDTGTNSSDYGCIDLSNNAKLYGIAFSGPGSDPDNVILTRHNSEIFGEKQALSDIKELPSVTPPGGLPSMGDYYLGSNDEDTISENGEYSSFLLRSNAEVTVTADVTLYITGEFSMRSNTKLEIADGVSVTIYLGGSFEQRSNTRINNLSQNPLTLIVLGTDSFNGEMEWNSNSDFWGAVYVPQADVEFESNSHFYGSIVAKSMELDSNAKLHYDEALVEFDAPVGGGGSSNYAVKSWQEKINK